MSLAESYLIEFKKNLSYEERKEVLEINNQNLKKNSGYLHFEGLLYHDYVALAKFKNKIIAYVLLTKSFLIDNDIFVMQIAVENNFKHKGIGENLYNYIYKHLKGFNYFSSTIENNNVISQNFHLKLGFKKIGQCSMGNVYTKKVNEEINKTITQSKPEICYFKDNKNLNMLEK